MKVFVTGATGFIGSRVVDLLLEAGHEVSALVRTERSAKPLAERGVKVILGDLASLDAAAEAAQAADGVLHLAFVHDFANFQASCDLEMAFVTAINKALAGSGKPFVATSGAGHLGDSGNSGLKEDAPAHGPRAEASESTVLKGVDEGVKAMVLRLPPFVYADGSSGFVKIQTGIAMGAGFAPYIGSGQQQWATVHVDDAAAAYLAALAHGKAREIYHIACASGIGAQQLAEAISHQLKSEGKEIPAKSIPHEEAGQFYPGFLAIIFAINVMMDSSKAQRELHWEAMHKTSLAAEIAAVTLMA